MSENARIQSTAAAAPRDGPVCVFSVDMGEWHGTYLLFLLAQSEVALDLLLLELLLGRQDLLAHLPSLDLAFAFGLKRKKKKKKKSQRCVD